MPTADASFVDIALMSDVELAKEARKRDLASARQAKHRKKQKVQRNASAVTISENEDLKKQVTQLQVSLAAACILFVCTANAIESFANIAFNF